MREQLIQYVNLLFAGASGCAEVKAEILQNTLDRYDDLVTQGKSPETAYRLAISGIGDINEILGSGDMPAVQTVAQPEDAKGTPNRKLLQALGIALYILCPLPLFLLQDEVGLCLLLVIVAAATVLMVISSKSKDRISSENCETEYTPKKQLRKSIGSVIWTVGLAAYLLLSFSTGAWHITWVLFPIIGSIQGLIVACIDLKEAKEYEN